MRQATRKEIANRDAYRKCTPKQFGNVHERMKLVVELLNKCDRLAFSHELWTAIYDLETEVSFYEPKNPPHGQSIALEIGR